MNVITVLPAGRKLSGEGGTLLELLRREGLLTDAPCGGQGKCGKCRVTVDGREQLACRVTVDQDMTVTLPEASRLWILADGEAEDLSSPSAGEGCLLACDIGTTTLVCALLDGATGRELAVRSSLNPQAAYGADVVTRIRAGLSGDVAPMRELVRRALSELALDACREAGAEPEEISRVSVVGNPCMRQLFLGIPVDNLAQIPFAPRIREPMELPCGESFPFCPDGALITPPDISGFLGADTIACLLSTKLYGEEELTLLVDIGTNGEMVLGNNDRMIGCATAAGPALEGAGIQFGMRAAEGAIDRVWAEDGKLRCHVLGEGPAKGICGSGLIDAAAAALGLGLLDKRGKILQEDTRLHLTDDVYLTQEDIRQLQLAKGAIRAGIGLMTATLGAELSDIRTVLLAGAFGTFLDPGSACRIGLLPEELEGRTQAVGNAALAGAKLLARDPAMLALSGELAEKTEYLELGTLPAFPRAFAKAMLFREEKG